MLYILRTASSSGALGSVFTIGIMTVTLEYSGPFSAKFRCNFADGSVVVSNVPYNRPLSPLPGVTIVPVKLKRTPIGGRTIRIGIHAPKHMNIERDDMKRRAA